ncbi:MAG: arginase family protein [Pseudomonadota bacterium]
MTYPDWKTFTSTSFAAGRDYPLLAPETPSFMSQPVAKTPADLKGADIAVIGAPYVAASGGTYAGVPMEDWIAAPKRVRQQSARYPSGYIQDFDLDVFETIKLVDYGDADIPAEAMENPTAENVLAAQAAVEAKVNDALDAGAVPIVIGQNSPCGSYAIAKPVAEHTDGPVGCISLDTHWDAHELDYLTGDPRIAGSSSWKHKMYEFLDNMHPKHLVEIGERGMLEDKRIVRRYLNDGARFISSWELRSGLGIEGLVKALDQAYDGTKGQYIHFDMDCIGGAGPAPGDILGELAEPVGMTDYEVIRIAHEIGRRGLTGMSFICIPPGSAVVYRVIVYIIMYLAAGLALRKHGRVA